MIYSYVKRHFTGLLLILVILSLYQSLLRCEEIEWEKLSPIQKFVAFEIYETAKPLGLEMTMIAIAFQESRLGKYPVNLTSEKSCGAHHIQIDNYLIINKIKVNDYNRNFYCGELINDPRLSTVIALEIFSTFRKFHNGVYNKALRSYNGGYYFDNTPEKAFATNKYYQEVYHNVKILEKLRKSVFEKELEQRSKNSKE